MDGVPGIKRNGTGEEIQREARLDQTLIIGERLAENVRIVQLCRKPSETYNYILLPLIPWCSLSLSFTKTLSKLAADI